MSAVDLLSLWYTALAADVGIKVQSSDPERLRQRLYQVRKGSGDPALDGLSLIISPLDPECVWIVKKELPK